MKNFLYKLSSIKLRLNKIKETKKKLFYFIVIFFCLSLNFYIIHIIREFYIKNKSKTNLLNNYLKNIGHLYFLYDLSKKVIKYNYFYLNKNFTNSISKFFNNITKEFFSYIIYEYNFTPSLVELELFSKEIESILDKINNIENYLKLWKNIK